ncbi:MAG TPA: hypothetical protein VEG38_23165 [Acidimicrobiia bacterium]|nr:hypothetical protein [Acidimicrobiia bacterium]
MIGLLRRLATLGFRRGMGGNRIWLALGVLSWFAARAKEKSDNPPALYCETLRPGESVAIRVLDPPR